MKTIKFKNKTQMFIVIVICAIAIGSCMIWIISGFSMPDVDMSAKKTKIIQAPAPKSIPVEEIKVVSRTVTMDSDQILELSKKIRIAQLEKQYSDLTKPKVNNDFNFGGSQQNFAAPPINDKILSAIGKDKTSSDSPLQLKMVIHDLDPIAYIEKDGHQVPVHIGQSAFGHIVNKISENGVCFKDYHCLQLTM